MKIPIRRVTILPLLWLAAASTAMAQTPAARPMRRGAGTPALRPSVPPLPSTPDPTAQIIRGIRTISPTHHTITERAMDLMLENQLAVTRSIRAIPHLASGRTTGVRLFGLRPQSPIAALGFQNGDILQTLNGRSIATPQTALEAYAALRSERVIRAEIIRAGAPLTLVIERVGQP